MSLPWQVLRMGEEGGEEEVEGVEVEAAVEAGAEVGEGFQADLEEEEDHWEENPEKGATVETSLLNKRKMRRRKSGGE